MNCILQLIFKFVISPALFIPWYNCNPYFLPRFDPKKPTEYPKDKQLTHPDQPYHIYFSKDEKRREFFSEYPQESIQITYKESVETKCDRWIKNPDDHSTADEDMTVDEIENSDVLMEFWKIENNCDVSDILRNAGIEIDTNTSWPQIKGWDWFNFLVFSRNLFCLTTVTY